MERLSSPWSWLLFSSLVASAFAGCGGGNDDTAGGTVTPGPTGGNAAAGAGGSSGGVGHGGAAGKAGGAQLVGGSSSVGGGHLAGGAAGSSTAMLDVKPEEGDAALVLTVGAMTPTPSVTLQSLLGGQPITAGWSVDRGDLASLDAQSGPMTKLTAKGAIAGVATVTAGLNATKVQRHVTIKIHATQNGATSSDIAHDMNTGAGVGGVGGEGVGAALDPTKDKGTLTALASPLPADGQKLRFLYPYDKTVWPRGMLPPLLQWDSSLGDADAISISLDTMDGNYSYQGVFGRPAMLPAGAPFVHHPIPIDAWNAATNSAQGSNTLTVRVVVAKGGKAYGPITETWKVAPARLTGTVYYNSYGTHFVHNWGTSDKAGNKIGGAILSVRSGDITPKIASGTDTACHVCHTVATGGGRMIVQQDGGDPNDKNDGASNGQSFVTDITPTGFTETKLADPFWGVFGWSAMTADGGLALTNSINGSNSNSFFPTDKPPPASALYTFGTAPASAAAKGLPAGFSAGYPTFSPDDTKVAFDYAGGEASGAITKVDATANGGEDRFRQLAVATFDKSTLTFSDFQLLATAPSGQRLGYPSFAPAGDAVLYQVETRSPENVMVTRHGARGELWWTTLATPQPVALASANGRNPDGTSYLPSATNLHGVPTGPTTGSQYGDNDEAGLDDTTLNYEPTINPVASGGFAWVVFTSRRMYGNVLTATPWQSWPPDYDTQDATQATTKKLWVAAIDLNAPPGSDPSHPAFYLPAQEILAGNSRGFWVLDPCHADNTSCETGDQCCGGYCQPSMGDPTKLVCSHTTTTSNCAMTQEKCSPSTPCCDMTQKCQGGFCTVQSPEPH